MRDNHSKRFSYASRLFDRAQTCELSDDFTLPDYMPAIGKVLSCNAVATTPTLYLGSGNAEYAGGVRYSVLYESADDSSLWCADLPSEYDIILSDNALPKDPTALSFLPDASAENVSVRVTAPRKVTIKCKVRVSPELRTYAESETLIHGEANDDLKILTAKENSGYYASISNSPITCKDILTRAEAGLSSTDEFRIISSRGDVVISHIQLSEDGALCRGEVCAHILLTREGEGERPRKMLRKIPFTETLPITNSVPEKVQIIGIRSTGICPALNAIAKEDGIELEATVILSAEIAGVHDIDYIKDAYSLTYDCETSKRNIKLLSPIACWSGNATVSSSKPLSDLNLDSGMRLCDVRAALQPDTKTEISENGRFIASGKIKFSAIADNGAELIPVEFDADMKYISDICNEVPDSNLHISITASTSEVKGRIDTDRLVCDCELYISCLVDKEINIKCIDEINLTPCTFTQPNSSHIRVCYPAKGETLWDIAKRYRIDSSTITEKNSLESSSSPDLSNSLNNAKFLII